MKLSSSDHARSVPGPAELLQPRRWSLPTGPLTDTELISVEDLLREGRAAKLVGQRRRELPTVFSTGSPADEPILPCPLTDVSWMDEL